MKINKNEKKIIQIIKPVEIRLNKFIANAGICSRRDADKLILSGKISVNDRVVQVLGTKVMATDKITYLKKPSNQKSSNMYCLISLKILSLRRMIHKIEER